MPRRTRKQNTALKQKLPDASLNQLMKFQQALQQRQWSRADRISAQLAETGNVGLLHQMAQAYRDCGQQRQALYLWQQVLSSQPRHVPALQQVASLLIDHDLAQAIAYLRDALKSERNNPETLILLGQALSRTQGLAEASLLLHKAAKLKPSDPRVWQALGDIARYQGEFRQAADNYQRVLKLNPRSGGAWKKLADLGGDYIEAVDIAKLQKLYDQQEAGAERCLMASALARYEDQQGRYAQAFAYYQQAGEFVRSQVNQQQCELLRNQKYAARISRVFTREKIDRYLPLSSTEEQPLFILGMPRSGTTLVESILSAHSDVSALGEFFLFGQLVDRLQASSGIAYPELLLSCPHDVLREMAQFYVRQMQAAAVDSKVRYITDKTPQYFQFIGLIKALWPQAKIIHCKRDPIATCVSIYTQGFSPEHFYAADLSWLGQYYRQYQVLMAHWQQVFDEPYYTVEYERLVHEPQQQIKDLLLFCDLPFEEQCLNFHKNTAAVRTPSYQQVRQPVTTDAMEKWRRFDFALDPLKQALKS